MNVLVIEDEPLSADKLVAMLAQLAPGTTVVAQLASVDATVRWLSAHPPPDLIFADVELQDGAIFDAFRQTRSVAPVIFTTAYDRFVLDAFRAQGIAYLLKPFGEVELAAALTKYDDLRRGFARFDGRALDALLHQLAAEPRTYRRHFTVKAGRRIRVLPLDRVALVVLGSAGVELIDTAGAAHFPSADLSLTEIEHSLPPAQFFRINRTEIVALDAIDHVERDRDRITVALKPTGRSCTVSVHRAAAFRTWIG
jgi:DNA-binding LytR/AlgR family response regulator